MSFQFRPAVRENVSLLIGLAGASGSGKTYTAMRLAKGIAGDKPFCVIDTEAGRAKHYADQFRFDHGDFRPPFEPSAYADAILAADKAGCYPVIVIDSFSHEHAGEGGILDMQEAEYHRMGAREAVKMTSWIKPKGEHRKMVSRLLQVRAHLILCFRAEEKIEMVKGPDGKMEVRKKVTATGLDGWVPICEKNLPYELTASFLLMAAKPGVPLPIKLQEQHKALFPLDKPITEESGARLAAWARGGSPAHETDSRTPLSKARPEDAAAPGLPARVETGSPANEPSKVADEAARASGRTRGQLIGQVMDHLAAGVGNGNPKANAAMLRAVTVDMAWTETGAATDLTTEQLEHILTIPIASLKKIKEQVGL